MKPPHVVLCASIILSMLFPAAVYAGQPQKPKVTPTAKPPALLGNSYWTDLKKVEKPDVNLTIKLENGWVFGNVARINQNIISNARSQQRRQSAQSEANRRLAALYHKDLNCLIHVLYIDNKNEESPMGIIARRKAQSAGTQFDEKYYIIQGCGLALIAHDTASNGASLKKFNAYFAPAEGHVVFHLIGIMPGKSYEKIDDIIKEATSKFTFKSKDASAGFKVARKEDVTETSAKPLIKEEWLVTDKKEAKKKSKKSSSPLWKVKRDKDWQWMDIDAWKQDAKPDTSKWRDRQGAQKTEAIWGQRVVGMYNKSWDCYVVLRAITSSRESKVEDIFTQNKDNLSSNKEVKMLTANPKYPMYKTMGARIGFSQKDPETGRQLASINYFACKGFFIYIVEVTLPEVKYNDFLKYEKKKKFMRKNFMF